MSEHNNRLLKSAAYHGRIEDVARLIPISDPTDENSEALRLAVAEGHLDVARMLVPFSNAFIGLKEAAWYGRVEFLRFLKTVCDPHQEDDIAIGWAIRSHNIECVKLLLPGVDPKDKHSRLLWMAALEKCNDIVDLVWAQSDPWDAIAHIQLHHSHRSDAWQALETRACHEQNMLLHNNVLDTKNPLGRRKL